MLKKTGAYLDSGGATAAQGTVSEDAVIALLSDPFFAETPPKSLDRNTFAAHVIDGLSAEDGAATLTAFTARAIAKAREHMPDEPELWVVAGGGRLNRTIMRMLAELVPSAVVPAEAVGLDGDSLEAEAWAYLAVRSIRGLPITFPGTTGVSEPMSGGVRADPTAHVIQ
jgi:anhydro-N-acetylmuramic acid kinase